MFSWRLIQKAKAILERERGTIKKQWGGRIPICLVYPNSYFVGMSNLGFQTIYHRLNSEDDVVCERAFLPEPEDIQEYHTTKTQIFSLESQRPLLDFEILAFSISFENDFPNILTILDLARIPFESHIRKDGYPLLIGGGVAIFLNPEPLSEIFDLFIIGEGEEVISEFLDNYRKIFRERRNRDKEELLRSSGGIEGVYVPRYYHVIYHEDGKIKAIEPEQGFPRRIKRRWVSELDRFQTRSIIFTPDTEFKDMFLIELSRGCPRKCRFCAVSSIYHPFRNRNLSSLESTLRGKLLKKNRIGLTGAAVSDYPKLLPLCQEIISNGGEISLSSLRLDTISPTLTQCLKDGGVKTVAIAPEAGSERLRNLLKKGYTEEKIFEGIRNLFENHLFQIKCYFMIGLPTENDEDLKAIITLSKRIRHQIIINQKIKSERLRMILSVNPFVPKPATPFQWFPLDEVGSLKRKLRMIQKGIRGERGMEMIHDLPKWAYIQTLLARGDRKIGKILIASHSFKGNWGMAFRDTNINPEFYVYRERGLKEIFPWDFIDHGIPKEKLIEEYLDTIKEAGLKIEK